MVQARYIRYPLKFHRPAGTSRGTLQQKACWFLKLEDRSGMEGLGEVSFIPGLSLEDPGEIEIQLDHVCKLISRGEMDPSQELPALPGIQFALECAMKDLEQGGRRILFPSAFTSGEAGIPINGLIWMGERTYLEEQIAEKLEQGFRVLKMKAGALETGVELEVLGWIRSTFHTSELEIRLDANGAWTPAEAVRKMDLYAEHGIHSIEQPIAAGQPAEMAALCSTAPVPIAIDEELIGIREEGERRNLLEMIKPAYVILKPGLLGGFSVAGRWIELAEQVGAGWWITSALESSVGLNDISQWTYQLGVSVHQGLGTGMLYSNNIDSPLVMEGDRLWHRKEEQWDLSRIGKF